MVESESISIPSSLRDASISFDFALPEAMQAVAAASASMAVGAMTVALITSVCTGRPVSGDMVCPRVLFPCLWKLR